MFYQMCKSRHDTELLLSNDYFFVCLNIMHSFHANDIDMPK